MPMNSLDKMLALLDVFTPEAPIWSIEQLAARSGTTRSTCYRYARSLQLAGLLSPVGQGAYMLGSRVIELDRNIRVSDPIYLAGGEPLQALSKRAGQKGILCVLYSDAVMCVREVPGVDALAGSFSRGQKRPLFTAAASKVILAELPAHQLRRLYAKHGDAIGRAGLGCDWNEFRAALRRIRDDGHCITVGEFTPGIVGIAAPIFNRAGQVLGSIGLAMTDGSVDPAAYPAMAHDVMAAAAETTRRIGEIHHAVDLPARAVG